MSWVYNSRNRRITKDSMSLWNHKDGVLNCRGCSRLHNNTRNPINNPNKNPIYNAKVRRRVLIRLLKFISNFCAYHISFLFLQCAALDRERLKEALGLVSKIYSGDDDENPEKMSQKEFNTKAEVLMKGTNSLRVTFLFIFPQKNTRICIITIYYLFTFQFTKRVLYRSRKSRSGLLQVWYDIQLVEITP